MMTYYIFTYKFPHPKNATAGTANTGNSTEDSSTVAANGTVDSGQGGDGDERNLCSFPCSIFGQNPKKILVFLSWFEM